jgi:uncharacterized protein (TIGR03435 family)
LFHFPLSIPWQYSKNTPWKLQNDRPGRPFRLGRILPQGAPFATLARVSPPYNIGRSPILRSLIAGLLLFATPGYSQSAAAPAFEVASVKLTVNPEPYHWEMSPGHLRLRSINLRQCIIVAYQVRDFQVSGGPGWVDADRYDIDGNADGPAPRDELLLMLRTLLEQRFHLVLRSKERPADGYAMVVAKGGLKIQPDTSEGRPAIQVTRNSMTVARFPMVGLAGAVSTILGIPVSDATETPGAFAFAVKWTPQETRMTAASADMPEVTPPVVATATSLGDALAETAGLRLERRKVSVQVLVIESVERPSGN